MLNKKKHIKIVHVCMNIIYIFIKLTFFDKNVLKIHCLLNADF